MSKNPERIKEMLDIAFEGSKPTKLTLHLCNDNIKVDMIIPSKLANEINNIDGDMERYKELLSDYFESIYLSSIEHNAIGVLVQAYAPFHSILAEISMQIIMQGTKR